MDRRFGCVGTGLLGLVVATALGWAVLAAQQVPPGGQSAPPTGTAMIAGRVLDADSGQGIPGTLVNLNMSRPGGAAAGVSQLRLSPVLTDSQGRFVFTSLPAGSYFATLESQSYILQAFARIIDVAAGAQVTDFNFRMNKFNTVLGTVRDDVGDPIVGTEVLAFTRSVPSGRPPVLMVRGRSRTDDRGEYRINQLPAGQYVICACNRDVIPLDGQLLTTLAARPLDLLSVARRAAVAGADVASLDATLRTYAPTFYPNTPLASRAERVALAKGETKTTVDITVTTVRAVRVSGQIIGAPASTISAASMRLIPIGDVPEAAAITQLPPMLVQSDGRFDFSGVPPGTYTLEVNATPGMASSGPSGLAMSFLGSRGGPPAPPPPPAPARGGAFPPQDLLWASETISVGERDVTGLVVGIQRGVTIHGKLEFSGTAPLPPGNAKGGVIQLVPMELRPARSASYAAQLNPDGTFAFVVPPGRYVIPSIPSFPPVWTSARSITARGVDIFDAPLVVDGDIPDLVITLTDTPSPSLMGTAELPSGEIPEEWAVLIFPSDRRLWKEPFAANRRFLFPRLTAARTFTPRLPPGEYMVTLSHGLPPDWMEAAALEELAKSAISVSVVEGDKKVVRVKR